LIAAGIVLVFIVATRVQPYDADGAPMRMASHQSIGLPPCRFQQILKVPCPSCGMTTSFALLVRGDIVNSLRANWVGTALAVFSAILIPWSLLSAFRGKFLWVKRLEDAMTITVAAFTIAMLVRWGAVLLLEWFA
jgi:hypothetical protein